MTRQDGTPVGQAQSQKPTTFRIEWPTTIVAATTYLCFGLLTWFYESLPWWLLLPLGGYIVCLHGSLQHEAVHGHPTSSTKLNEALVFPSLWLWMPYRLYLRDHLAHHNNDIITDPLDDPESYYRTAESWAQSPAWWRGILRFNNTLFGRLTLGPLLAVGLYYHLNLRNARAGEKVDGLAWALHGVSVVLTLAWVMWICGIPLLAYILLFAYPGLSLTLLRSYLEHQARSKPEERTVIIDAEAPLALVFLNNNLHAVHHALPGMAWYRLPAAYRGDRDRWRQANGGYCFSGYAEVARRYLFTAKEPVLHPLGGH